MNRVTLRAGGLIALALATTACGDSVQDSGNGVGPSSRLELVSRNILFDKSDLKAKAGEITIIHRNEDPGTPHNVAIYENEEAANSGADPIAATEIEAGIVVQELKVTLAAGEYFFRCDVHPVTMTGKLTVE